MDSRRRFLSSCLTMRESSTVPVKGGVGELVATVAAWRGGLRTGAVVSTPTKKQMPQRNQVAGGSGSTEFGAWNGDWVIITTALEEKRDSWNSSIV